MNEYEHLIRSKGNGRKVIMMQAYGLGDIIFCQQIALILHMNGWNVEWPVQKQFLEGLQRSYPLVNFIDEAKSSIDFNKKTLHKHGSSLVIPIRWSYQILKVPMTQCMTSKYDLFNLDWKAWKLGGVWERDKEKEQELLKLVNPSGYRFNLINKHFRSDGSGVARINVNNGLMNVNMMAIPGFSLFDWAGVIEAAHEVHTVSTSILYIVEILQRPTHFYVRRPADRRDRGTREIDHRNTKHLLSKIHYLHN